MSGELYICIVSQIVTAVNWDTFYEQFRIELDWGLASQTKATFREMKICCCCVFITIMIAHTGGSLTDRPKMQTALRNVCCEYFILVIIENYIF